MQGLSLAAMRLFVRDTRAGATAIAAAAVTVMTVGGAALISDHAWLVDQRDVLKTAADAADATGIAATLAMTRLAGQTHTDEELEAELEPVVKRYILLNLEHLPPERYEVAEGSLDVTLDIDRDQNTVDVTAVANLGGTLFSRHMPLLGNYEGPSKILAKTGTECSGGTIEIVLALTLPGDAPVPAFMYPDTNRLDPALIAQVRQTIFDDFSAHGVEESLGATGVDQLLGERSENPWDGARRGPNYHCAWTAMLPLSSDRVEVERMLDSLYDTEPRPRLSWAASRCPISA